MSAIPKKDDGAEGEISPEALQRLNALLDEGPGEDATEEEVEAFMKKFSKTEGGAEMLKTLTEQLAEGGGEMLAGFLGSKIPSSLGSGVPSLYQAPQSPLRLVFHMQPVGAEILFWRRVTLPSDACFFDLRCALQDAFLLEGNGYDRIEWREGEKVIATFLSGDYQVKDGDDYCEFSNQPLDLFSEGVTKLFFCAEGSENCSFIISIEKLIEPSGFQNPVGTAPDCIGGQGPRSSFDPSSVEFRILGG